MGHLQRLHQRVQEARSHPAVQSDGEIGRVSRPIAGSDPTSPVAVRVGAPAIPKPPTPSLQFAATPYPHVAVQFAKAPAGLMVVVERQFGADNAWLRVAGPLSADEAAVTDNAPPDSRPLAYRVAYVSAGGQVGPSSDPATLK